MNSEPRRLSNTGAAAIRRKEGNKVLVTDLAFNNWSHDSSLEVDVRPDWVDP